MKQPSQKKIVNGKYVVYLSKPLGQGTFAKTYLCKPKSDPSSKLACKLMNKNQIKKVVDNLEYIIQRVKEESNAWKQLDHPHIVKFEASEQTDNNIYFFLEYCGDGSLEQYISKNRFAVDVKQALRYSKQLVQACAYLESKNIVHRDIKPENILLKDNNIKLGDFGLARAIKPDDDKNLHSFFTFAGTLQYMAPEIIKEQKHPYKCDVWSVGVTIYVMFTGELPFGLTKKDSSEKVILDKIEHNKEEYRQEIFVRNQEVVGILRHMLNPNSLERPNMREILQMFEKL